MAYQHANRLTAHWQPKTLKVSAKLIAKHLAENIQSDGDLAGRFYHSAEKIALELGLSEKATRTALNQLLEAGVFDSEVLSSHRSTGLRTYSLAIECPPDCSKITSHYTALELAAKPRPETLATGKNDLSNTPSTGKTYRSYKELVKRDIDIDIENSPSFDSQKVADVYLEIISQALAELETETANHLLLKTCLEATPELVVADALRIAKKATKNPEAYLAKIVRDTPQSLFEASRASLAADMADTGTKWPKNLISVLRANALDIIGERLTEQKLYDEYLLASGGIPADLVEIAEARGMGYLSLEHLVADCRAIANGIELRGLDLENLAISLGTFEPPNRSDFGSNSQAYNEALDLYQKRVKYQKAFDQKQASLVEEWLKVHADETLSAALNSEQIEALEAERLANPELQADPEHYTRLMLTELYSLPALETLAEYLTGNDHLENVTLPQLQGEFLEFWNAYPTRPEGKGRKLAALNAWCQARKTKSHQYLMSELRGSFLGIDPRFISYPSSWLAEITSEQSLGVPFIGDRL